jgi:exodeoxyribonuclease X
MITLLIDTETTGFVEPEPIEIALALFFLDGCHWQAPTVARLKPSKSIELGALAVHHIMDEDLVDCRPSSSFALPEETQYLIGYNVDYDWGAIGKPGVKRIDVCAMCRMLWPSAESHSQGAMLYLLRRGSARAALQRAHSAAVDLEICGTILGHVVAKAGLFPTIEALWEFSERARIPTVMPFGKHKGMPIADVPADYKRWLLGQSDVDSYLQQALRGEGSRSYGSIVPRRTGESLIAEARR